MNKDRSSIAFKCTWNDKGFKGVCSEGAYRHNIAEKRIWCSKAPCRTFKGRPSEEHHPCYESIIFSAWRFGAGWDHKHEERPRKINNTDVGKLALLTTVEPGKEEKDRRIVGFFKISRIDDGEKKETIVHGDPLGAIEIDASINTKFWDYYSNPNAPEKRMWGTGLFRYMDDASVLSLLRDLKNLYEEKGDANDEILKIDQNIKCIGQCAPRPEPRKSGKIISGKTCSNCSHMNPLEAAFCNKCGEQFEATCKECQTINPAGSNYCHHCGKKLNLNNPSSPEVVRDKLLEYGKELLSQERPWIFTPIPEGEKLVLENSNAFLLAVIFDQSIDAEKAWTIPYELTKEERIGHLDPNVIGQLTTDEIEKYFQNPSKLHRFWPTMARRMKKACILLKEKYGGEAKNIWADNPDSRFLYSRLREFDGIGQKKASMTVNILSRELGVPIQNKSGIDVSYDVMVRRVFVRTGLVKQDTLNDVIEVARKLHPEYPGELDYPSWYIGRTFCFATNPGCKSCPLKEVCPKVGT